MSLISNDKTNHPYTLIVSSAVEGKMSVYRNEPNAPRQAQNAFISNKQSVEWWEILIEIHAAVHREETKANNKKKATQFSEGRQADTRPDLRAK